MTLTSDDLLAIPHLQALGFEDLKGFTITGVSTDSRGIKRGDLFIAIRGAQFDGHNFISRAVDAGAAAIVVDDHWAKTNATMLVSLRAPRMVVENTVYALGNLARNVRRSHRIPVIAVGGSNGKTTTKDMIAAVLAMKFNVLKTDGNLNNHIGVPHMLFRLSDEHQVAVIEIGTNHPGEIAYLCDMLEPTHGIITNVGREHLEFFGSIEGVASAETELFTWLREHKGTAFVNVDDPHLARLGIRVPKRVTFGFTARTPAVKGTVAGTDERGCARVRIRPKDRRAFDVSLSVPGEHNAKNALAATSIGVAFRIPAASIQRALEGFTASNKRMQVLQIAGVTILNDTYNSNPDSALAALSTLRTLSCPGRKIVVLADMLEMGPQAGELHREVGHAVGLSGADILLTYGPLSKMTHDAAVARMKSHYDQKNVLAEYLLETLSNGDVVLIKGSRGMKMEDVIVFLQERLPRKGQA